MAKKEYLIQNVVMARRRTREGPWGPWHIMGDWQTAICGKSGMADWKRIGRFSHCNTGKVCHTCWHAMNNHRAKIGAMIMDWDRTKGSRTWTEKDQNKAEDAARELTCILCRPEKKRTTILDSHEVPIEPGWRMVGYTDGDQYSYCPDHSPEEVLQDMLNRCDQEIGLYCGIERVYGFGETRRCAHLDLYFVILDDKDTLAQAMPMSLEGATNLRKWKLKDYPEATIMPCTLVCNFCEYGYPK